MRFDEHASAGGIASLIEEADAKNVAVVTDAGTPGISDPGTALVAAARAAGVPVEVLPGPVAFVCAAVLSGFALSPLTFEGFFPRAASARRKAIADAMERGGATVWYESPHRIVPALQLLAQEVPAAHVFIVRELTKKFEQQVLGTPAEVLAALPTPPRGEFTLVLRGSGSALGEDAPPRDERTIDQRIDTMTAQGHGAAAIAKALSHEGHGERATLYARATARRRKSDR